MQRTYLFEPRWKLLARGDAHHLSSDRSSSRLRRQLTCVQSNPSRSKSKSRPHSHKASDETMRLTVGGSVAARKTPLRGRRPDAFSPIARSNSRCGSAPSYCHCADCFSGDAKVDEWGRGISVPRRYLIVSVQSLPRSSSPAVARPYARPAT